MLLAIVAALAAISFLSAAFLYVIVRVTDSSRNERAQLLDRIQAPDLTAMRVHSDMDRIAMPTDADVDRDWLSQKESEVPWDADLAIGRQEDL